MTDYRTASHDKVSRMALIRYDDGRDDRWFVRRGPLTRIDDRHRGLGTSKTPENRPKRAHARRLSANKVNAASNEAYFKVLQDKTVRGLSLGVSDLRRV